MTEMLTGAPDAARMAAASATSRTRISLASGHSSRAIDSLSDGTCSPHGPAATPNSCSTPGGGHEWSLVSLCFGLPARSDSSTMEYGSHLSGQYGSSAVSSAQPSETSLASFSCATSKCLSPPVCGAHRKEPRGARTSSETPCSTSERTARSLKSASNSICSTAFSLMSPAGCTPAGPETPTGMAGSPRSSGRRSQFQAATSGSMDSSAETQRSGGRIRRAARQSPLAARRMHRLHRLSQWRTRRSQGGLSSCSRLRTSGAPSCCGCGAGSGSVRSALFSSATGLLRSSARSAGSCACNENVGLLRERGTLSSLSLSRCGSAEPISSPRGVSASLTSASSTLSRGRGVAAHGERTASVRRHVVAA